MGFMIWAAVSVAQAPQKMSFQGVVRNSDGELITEQRVGVKISVVKDAPNGDVVFSETHEDRTNSHGLITLIIGEGSPIEGNLANIDWSSGTYYLRSDTDPEGGMNYTISGANPLLSVPYALYAHKAQNGDRIVNLSGEGATTVTGNYPNFIINSTDNNTTYDAGFGIDITGTTITNAAPDQVVTLQGEGNTSISGTYPNFKVKSTGGTVNYSAGDGIDISGTTITNTAPDKVVTLEAEGATEITGTYPNFTITTVDSNRIYNAGTGIEITGDTITNTAPDIPVSIRADSGIVVKGSYPDFRIAAESSDRHYVGERYGGGIVFYTYDGGRHGLIASLRDLGDPVIWNGGPSSTSAESHYDGSTNTDRIVNNQGAGNYAASICRNYNGGGFSDWFLPSIWELNLLYQNGFVVSFKLDNDNDMNTAAISAGQSYWSSTQFDDDLAYMIYFANGTPYLDIKTNSYRIRAVRRF
ncbi:MAG: DUF1566 domain-containing protein [Saprospiraceae bacterium]|nr:DUF1566 domain-containing protein [Saprospiraceae bacterium]